MSKIITRIVGKVLKPVIRWYLNKDRYYTSGTMNLLVKQGVFHPGFFFSTKILLRQLKKENLKGKKVLELGAGSGLISLYAAQQGGIVTATDINPVAIAGLQHNLMQLAPASRANLTILQSDLFEEIPVQEFDYILLNPPFYASDAIKDAELAWYAGEKLQYFTGLFAAMHKYVHQDSLVIMVFNDIRELETVKEIAAGNHWKLETLQIKNLFYERMFLFRIVKL